MKRTPDQSNVLHRLEQSLHRLEQGIQRFGQGIHRAEQGIAQREERREGVSVVSVYSSKWPHRVCNLIRAAAPGSPARYLLLASHLTPLITPETHQRVTFFQHSFACMYKWPLLCNPSKQIRFMISSMSSSCLPPLTIAVWWIVLYLFPRVSPEQMVTYFCSLCHNLWLWYCCPGLRLSNTITSYSNIMAPAPTEVRVKTWKEGRTEIVFQSPD